MLVGELGDALRLAHQAPARVAGRITTIRGARAAIAAIALARRERLQVRSRQAYQTAAHPPAP